MTIRVLFADEPAMWDFYRGALQAAFLNAGLSVELGTEFAAEDVDYIVLAPAGPISDFSGFTQLKAVLSLWAGVEKVVGNTTLTAPLTRMVEDDMTDSMVEWVTGHVLRHHLGIDANIAAQDGIWNQTVPPLARDRTVGLLGLGALGSSCAKALAALNFSVSGWSRSAKLIENVACYHGDEGLKKVLQISEFLVLLLPNTRATDNILNADRLAMMPKGAIILNPGRGTLIDDDALLAALDSGQIGHATLDVFRTEPLPPAHRFWAHARVTVTPHVAAQTRAETSARVIAENIRRNEAGEPMMYLVDRAVGY